jgi:Ni/Fe-hydrogenase 1 B-type cytochrome subunit
MKKASQSGVGKSWKYPAPGQVRVYVWEWPIRFSHWLLVITLVALSVTGYYMHSPYVVARGEEAYVMGTMRFIHLLSAFGFTLAIAVRLGWFFFGNRWSQINQYIPTTVSRWRQMLGVIKYFVYMAWSPLSFIGHNPLAGAAYMAIYGMAVVEIITGFALYSQLLRSSVMNSLIGWLPRYIDIQWLREIHFLIMFGFWMFFIYHLYTAILISIEEDNGLMDSIFSGYKFVPKKQLELELGDPESPAPGQPLNTPPPTVAGDAIRDTFR